MSDFADFPYEIVETSGADALATWEALKTAGRGAPVVLGGDIENLLAPFSSFERGRHRPVEEIIAEAATIKFPDDLRRQRREELAEALVTFRRIASIADYQEKDHEPPLGDWPDTLSHGSGLSVTFDHATLGPRSNVKIALIPTDDPTAIPAYMRFGNWNACPKPEHPIAALRAWRDRYGAELVGIASDVLDLRVSLNPATREDALELARILYVYCNDLIDQGVGAFRPLAAALMSSDWWYFWWD